MAFDQTTRNRLQRFVNDARRVLEEEFTRQLQNDYGMDPNAGSVAELTSLRHINDAQRETARILRDTLAHYTASGDMNAMQGLDRIVREQAFTVLNRLAALRMAEARGLLVESVGNGFQAKGFQLYARLAGTGLGETGDAYRVYLFSVFDELAQDLPGLFDRYSPQGRLFPREAALLQVLNLINDADIAPLWSEDETIGWIYQYFNSKEERKAMRDASQAPRNSRELAVRNQFFTPRYVVEFLVDNTLGRLWFNATGGATGLRDRCQYLLVKPDETPQAATKLRDPRTLKLLDPACGSMHFGLYAFDLFAEIYREAWAWEQQQGPGSLDVSAQPQAALKPLSQTYEDEAAFLRDVPRLIIEHNIYGVDIDPRAAQIASLALWLRAQRAWHDAGVKAKDRPLIGRGHVVAAIAPPAERELRQQFAANLDKRDAELFEKTLQLLKGLPELGVLLQVERELPSLIRQVYVGKGTGLFAQQEQENWQQAEARLRTALTEFAQAAKSTYQGRLFALDALEGLRLIDLIREKFDVTVMNPPFGAPTENTYEYIRKNYAGFHNDIYASFVARANELSSSGFVGCISSRSFLMSPRLEQFRSKVILPRLICLADFGLGVMDDAHVEAAAYVLGPVGDSDFSVIDLRKVAANRESALSAAIASKGASFFRREWFLALPQSKILYAAPERVRELLSSGTYFEPAIGTAREGMKSFDNFRFIRLWWEVEQERIGRGKSWERFSKGGDFSYFYLDTHLLLNWANEGAELKEINRSLNGSTAQVRQASDYWYMPGVTYSKRSAKGFSARVLPADTIFTSNGPAVLSTSEFSSLYLLGWINSRLVRGFIHLQSNFGDYSTGSLKRLPWVVPGDDVVAQIESASKVAVDASLTFRIGAREISPRFLGPHLCESLAATAIALQNMASEESRSHDRAISIASELLSNEYSIDDLSWADELLGEPVDEDGAGDDDAEGESTDHHDVSIEVVASTILSYAIGCVFGRWDFSEHISRTVSKEGLSIPDAFAAIPKFAPGQVDIRTEVKRLPNIANEHPDVVELGGICESTSGANNRLVERVRLIFDKFFHGQSGAWENDLCASLRVQKLADYIQRPNGFFSKHLAQYSLSGRQAPIYWPLSTASCDYTVWVYYPSLSNQTLYTAVNDFVEPKLKQVSDDVTALRNKGSARTRDDEKQFEALQAFELELIELRDTLLNLAPTYKPNHDDGVQISAAPLWPLFRHKPWQKVLKDTWVKLEKGDYDWAHLAMNYWPERVREKCKTDKSLAIVHGLEDLYIEPEAAPKKTRGRKKTGGDE
ncbi:TPA: BREX-1 system adenine-specific DNA-methyltransferase PglX [Pseudomonas aeruginosa]|uniref:BREX-1 system adenine-specific DNA-methyltransferase PglX n=1 Tax=Pseudomonadota TaxID=1224 RepID=UPI001F0F1A32|nr:MULTISPECIES: BREX-1 system adenine-specific DNA-methyltransferase PglX [Pseudomonadota]EKW1991492.1 BREX-1 system adenine-specific DNA-methyltransferase PglX [Pseudomonas aeruginosa]ELH7336556.1 BREX-1 system adenine-specific DNA-methyltransferase PglX [Pseudomonas aeruginosa]ELQ2722311.1 BREX-1 system adenine-specific DNA-methyltransferase PglX [Pseudomonas aeruginosa]ELQ2757132.1 BREX-1 system adenine-specific DNA-methyltransferase PglX [Pseudomonas aeruginosa]MCH4577998.1 BREX-1 system 